MSKLHHAIPEYVESWSDCDKAPGWLYECVGWKNPRGEEQPIPRGAIRMEHNKYVKQRKCLIAGYPNSSAEHKGLWKSVPRKFSCLIGR